jgi:alpha-tubulin suppressor-like RCC1 family protein
MFSKSASAGTVYVFGNNIDGQLGISSIEDHLKTPTCMDPPVEASRIARVVATKTNSFALTVDGSVLSAGSNENNELGRPGKRSLLSRLDALEAFRITDCACGDGFVMLTLKDGRTIGWGANDLGQLGLGR